MTLKDRGPEWQGGEQLKSFLSFRFFRSTSAFDVAHDVSFPIRKAIANREVVSVFTSPKGTMVPFTTLYSLKETPYWGLQLRRDVVHALHQGQVTIGERLIIRG